MIRCGTRAGVRLGLKDCTYCIPDRIMLYYIHRIDRTMQNAEAGGNRLHGRYGVQVAKHRQPFPQFRSILDKHDIQASTALPFL